MKDLPIEVWNNIFSFFSDEELIDQTGNIAVTSKSWKNNLEQHLLYKLDKNFGITNITSNLKMVYTEYYRGYKIIERFIYKKFPELEKIQLRPLEEIEPRPLHSLHFAHTSSNPIDSLYAIIDKRKIKDPIENKPFILAYIFIYDLSQDIIESDASYSLYVPNTRFARKGELFNSLLIKVLNIIDVNVIFRKDRYGYNALHHATRFGNYQATGAILEKAKNKIAACTESDTYNKTPLIYAAESGNFGTFNIIFNCFDNKEEICTQEINNNGGILYSAVLGGNIEIVQLVLNIMADKKATSPKVENFYKKSLFAAAEGGKAAIIKEILIHFTDKEKAALLIFSFAAKSGSSEAIQTVLNNIQDKKAACLKRDTSKRTPLHYAAASGNVEAINKILEYITDKKSICQEDALMRPFYSRKLKFNYKLHYKLNPNSVLGCAWGSGSTAAVKTILFYFDDKKSIWESIHSTSLGESRKINKKEIELYVNSSIKPNESTDSNQSENFLLSK